MGDRPRTEAIAHYGRIFKTLHILRLADDDPYRREGKAQANLTEGRHRLARRIYHGKKGRWCAHFRRFADRTQASCRQATTLSHRE
jgi:TnpA family transposase